MISNLKCIKNKKKKKSTKPRSQVNGTKNILKYFTNVAIIKFNRPRCLHHIYFYFKVFIL